MCERGMMWLGIIMLKKSYLFVRKDKVIYLSCGWHILFLDIWSSTGPIALRFENLSHVLCYKLIFQILHVPEQGWTEAWMASRCNKKSTLYRYLWSLRGQDQREWQKERCRLMASKESFFWLSYILQNNCPCLGSIHSKSCTLPERV